MAINDYGIRFTEEKYATKNEVARELKMSVVDAIWSPILKYRSTYNRYLSLKSIERNQLTICMCPTVSNAATKIENRFTRLLSEYNSLGPKSVLLAKEETVHCLKAISTKQKLEISEACLKDVINGYERSISADDLAISRYLAALKYIDAQSSNIINEDFLAGIYCKLLGTDELTYFYRDNESAHENRILIDRIYVSAPYEMIEPMMQSLFDFINKSNISTITKALTAFYYVMYIKPFAKYSEEMAILLMKAILAHESLGTIASFISFETLLVDNIYEASRLFTEVQKTNDLTYFLVFGYQFVENKVNELIDRIINLSRDVIKEDFYRPDDINEEESQKPEEPKSETEPLIEEKIVEVQKKETVKVESPKEVTKKAETKPVAETIAVSYIPPILDEKEAARLETHLLECDPLLKKGMAKFYSRHCTMGKMYTIAEYKKTIGCVYETARSSMDLLAELGYYQKQQIKNKFVYTPIARK